MSDPILMTATERFAIQGLNLREAQLRQDYAELFAAMDERLGLPAGSVGQTHGIDQRTWTVVAVGSPNGSEPEMMVELVTEGEAG